MFELIVAVTLAVALVAIVTVAIIQWRGRRKRFRLEIRNEGNVPSRYALRVEEPRQALSFLFAVNGTPLSMGTIRRTRSVSRPAGQAPEPPGHAASGSTAPDTSAARDRAKQAMATGGAIAGLLAGLGRLLPGSVGASLAGAAGEMRQGKSTVQRAQRVSAQAGKVGSQAGKVSSQAGDLAGPQTAADAAPPTVAAPGSAPLETEDGLEITRQAWARTPSVEPGRSLQVEMVVKLARPRKSQVYPFTILSQPADQEEGPPAVEEASIQVPSLLDSLRYMPYVVIVGLTLGAVALAFWLSSAGYLR
ncbi:MAG: hypothetical protein PVJ34_14855 [Anaerolineae bacterium]|jgi:hypothetical protein